MSADRILEANERGRMLASASYFPTTNYSAASRTSMELGGYNPQERSADSALLPERRIIDNRMRDMARNSGWVAGGVRKKVDKILGGKVRPQFKPKWRELGLTFEQGRELSRQMEAVFSIVFSDPRKMADAGQNMNFSQMARVQFRHHIIDGRALTLPLWLRREGTPFSTTFMLIDPRRLSNPNGKPDTVSMRGGIEISAYGRHEAYHIRERNPGDIMAMASRDEFIWRRVPARTRWGRPKVIYSFERLMAEQTAGVSQMVSGLKKMKMLENYDDYELQAAAINALFALAVESDLPSESIFKGFSMAPESDDTTTDQLAMLYGFNGEVWKQNSGALDGVRVAHLGIGEKMQQLQADRGGTNFVEAQQQWIRYFCNCLPGLSAEEFSNNFTKTSYVGIRAGFAAAHYAVQAEREEFADQMLTPMVDLVIEEAIDLGLITLPTGAPAYEMARGLYCNIEWVGPPQMVVDPQKEANAARIRLESGQDTLEDYLADIGRDPEEHLQQLAREETMRKQLGLPPLLTQQAMPGEMVADEQDDDPPAADSAEANRGGEF